MWRLLSSSDASPGQCPSLQNNGRSILAAEEPFMLVSGPRRWSIVEPFKGTMSSAWGRAARGCGCSRSHRALVVNFRFVPLSAVTIQSLLSQLSWPIPWVMTGVV